MLGRYFCESLGPLRKLESLPMKRVVEKVKDVVEVRPFTNLQDFGADPALTLNGYHFTDITADLMGKWLDRISHVRPGQGAAMALAGFRGVGKSHFLSVVGILVSRPELRASIRDSYVAASADRLSRRHGSVVTVRRGTGTSLVDELKLSVADLLCVNPGSLSDSLYDLLLRASEHAGETPLVVLIDTAAGRETRVSRDDGVILSEIAAAGDTLGIFVGVALDDDISGADGPNSSISTNFTISYLDQEHLYKIVDTHIFAKNDQQRPLLKEIYDYYRQVMPGFKWSEQRFVSLYPLHPATVEIAPLVRLYLQDFALLGFASDAGVRILGRPANSLIGLDEVFDSVETRLRAVAELKDAFATFDSIEQKAIASLPVNQRLHAKLILKGLLLLSLNGQGTTAGEIAASMMIFDDGESSESAIDTAKVLDSFVESVSGAIDRISAEGSQVKYNFRLNTEIDVKDSLADSLAGVSGETVWNCLLRQTAEKYSDIDASTVTTLPSRVSIEWRGAIRRGEVILCGDSTEFSSDVDWSVRVSFLPQAAAPSSEREMQWIVADLAADELDTIRRFHLLQNDLDIRERQGDGLSTAIHTHTIATEKIWQRVFLQDGRLFAGSAEYRFSEDASASHSLTQLFSLMLAPVLENSFPEHPVFSQTLGNKQVASVVAEFFSGSGSNSTESQRLAESYALPLGLAMKAGDSYSPSSSEMLMELPVVKAAFVGVSDEADAVINLSDLTGRFQEPPLGLTREAQRLVLSALVAQRLYEFVTSSGNRINHRSLDLQMIWDDIVGLAKPLNETFAPDRLLAWAQLITGNSGVRSINRSEDRLLIIDSLAGWLSAWNESRVLADFDAMPDENLNASIWRTAASLKKSFGAMAEAIDQLVNDEISLDQCLHAIAERFSDSEEEFARKKTELRILGEFNKSVARRASVASYLSLCEITDDPDLERSRSELLESIDPEMFWSRASDISQIEVLWAAFRDGYSSYYQEKHDSVMNRGTSGESLREILASPEWSAFECLFRMNWADQRFVTRSRELIREIRLLHCNANVRDVLAARPFCTCAFSLADRKRLADLPGQLRSTIQCGIRSIETRLQANAEILAEAAESGAMRSAVKRIFRDLEAVGGLAGISGQDLRIVIVAADRVANGDVSSAEIDFEVDDAFELMNSEMHTFHPADEQIEVLANQ